MRGDDPLLPPVVSEEAWQAARERLLLREEHATRERDALAAERRRLPMVRISKDYWFGSSAGEASLPGLFEGRRQLILYHFMFAPGVHGWPDAGCPGCSMFVDTLGHPAHLNARDTTVALVSRAPVEKLERFRQRMGWRVPWYSSVGSEFNADFGLTTAQGETFGLSVFLRDGMDVYRTYFTSQRGVEALGNHWSLLDLTPLGRQEHWEDSPFGERRDQRCGWWRLHDEYAR
jgi:predicted dithiol-disulfide oxidoreductase (DUF899 family)